MAKKIGREKSSGSRSDSGIARHTRMSMLIRMKRSHEHSIRRMTPDSSARTRPRPRPRSERDSRDHRKGCDQGTAKATAIRIFEALGEAEAEIHNTTVEQVHFHEVGAVDAMVDIVCAAVGAEALGGRRMDLFSSKRRRRHGQVRARNASRPCSRDVKLLAGAPVYSSGPQVGAGHADRGGHRQDACDALRGVPGDEDREGRLRRRSREFPHHPNLLRLTIGEAASAEFVRTCDKWNLARPHYGPRSELGRPESAGARPMPWSDCWPKARWMCSVSRCR